MDANRDRHGPRQDDALKKETRGLVQGSHGNRAEEWRDPEPAAEDQPAVDRGAGTVLDGTGGNGIPRADAQVRSDLARQLRRSLFPADRAALLRFADDNGVTGEIRELLDALPEGVEFANTEAVWETAGGQGEPGRF